MKRILKDLLIVFLSLFVTTSYAQRFPQFSYKSMDDINHDSMFDDSGPFVRMDDIYKDIRMVKDYRIALYKYYDMPIRNSPLKRFSIIKDWIEDNRYIQVFHDGLSVDYVQGELFKFEKGVFSFSDDYMGPITCRMQVPDEAYEIGMADNLSTPTREMKFKLTRDKLTYTIITDQQGGCGFRHSDEWVPDGNGASRGGIPVQPIDPHKENIGCNGGTHKEIAIVQGIKGSILIPYTYTCTHYIRQVPRSAGRRTGMYVRATGGYTSRNIPAGQVYIGMAGEYGGDPFAPWQFTYTTTVTISLHEMAKMNGMSLDELAYYMIALSQSNNGYFLPTNKVASNKIENVRYDNKNYMHLIDENEKIIASTFGCNLGKIDLEVFEPSIGDILAYGFWKVFNLDAYVNKIAKEAEIQGQKYEAEENYLKAKQEYFWSYNNVDNDSIFKKYEEMSYLELMQKIESNSAKLEDMTKFLVKFNNDKPVVVPEDRKERSKYWHLMYAYYQDFCKKMELEMK